MPGVPRLGAREPTARGRGGRRNVVERLGGSVPMSGLRRRDLVGPVTLILDGRTAHLKAAGLEL